MERSIRETAKRFYVQANCNMDSPYNKVIHLSEKFFWDVKDEKVTGQIVLSRQSVTDELVRRFAEIGSALVDVKVVEIDNNSTRLGDLLIREHEVAAKLELEEKERRAEIHGRYQKSKREQIEQGKQKQQMKQLRKGGDQKNVNNSKKQKLVEQKENSLPVKRPRSLVVSDAESPVAVSASAAPSTPRFIVNNPSASEDSSAHAMVMDPPEGDNGHVDTEPQDTEDTGVMRQEVNDLNQSVKKTVVEKTEDNIVDTDDDVDDEEDKEEDKEEEDEEEDMSDDDSSQEFTNHSNDPKFYVPFNNCYDQYRNNLDALVNAAGIEEVYSKLEFGKMLNNSNGKTANENFLQVQKVFGNLMVNDVVDLVKQSYGRDTNVGALWNFTRQIFNCSDNEIVEIQFRDLFYYIRNTALKQFVITALPRVVVFKGSIKLMPSGIALTKEQNTFNTDLRRRVTTSTSSVMKKVVYTYEWLNDNLASLPLDQMKGCGFRMPSGVNRDYVALKDDCVIKFVSKQVFNLNGYEEFKKCLFQKKNRSDPDTWLANQKKVKAERLETRLSIKSDLTKSKLLSGHVSKSDESIERDLCASSVDDSQDAHSEKADSEKTDSENPEGGKEKATEKTVKDKALRTSTLLECDIASDSDTPLQSTASTQKSAPKTPVSSKAYYECKIVLRQVTSVSGEHLNIRVQCDSAKNKEIQSIFQYHYVLTELVCAILDLLKESSEVAAEDIGAVVATSPYLQEVRFTTWRALSLADLKKSAGNTMPDGFCLTHATLQNSERSKDRLRSIKSLRDFDSNLPRELLARHIETYISCMNCRDKDVDLILKAKLKNMLYNAVNYPDLPNPMNDWGNSQMCRFLDGEIMIYSYEPGMHMTMHNGEPGLWGVLSVVNYGVLKRLFPPNHYPTFTLTELVDVYKKSNNIAFRAMHFFIVENHEDSDARSAEAAVEDWVDALVSVVIGFSEQQITAVRAFRDEVRAHANPSEEDLESGDVSCITAALALSLTPIDIDDDDVIPVKTTIGILGKPVCADLTYSNDALIATV